MQHGNDNDTRRRKQEKIWQMNLHDPKSGLYIIFSYIEIFNRKLLINQVPKNILGQNNRYSAYIHLDVFGVMMFCFDVAQICAEESEVMGIGAAGNYWRMRN